MRVGHDLHACGIVCAIENRHRQGRIETPYETIRVKEARREEAQTRSTTVYVIFEGLFRSAKTLMSSKLYDVVIFGATGYTGTVVVEQLAQYCATVSNLTWAVAGRSDTKLEKLLANVADSLDAGYITCAICVVQAAVTLLQELDKMPNEGGVYTPGAAFWKTSYLKRLQENGIVFETVSPAQDEQAAKKSD
nr:unnamed protein product [Spirometra erinaceieuropaei]